MRQFLEGTDAAYVDLRGKATGQCIAFPDQEMPATTSPPRARIGFEVDPTSGAACLFVETGRVYAGDITSVREWLAAGEKRFHDFEALKHWIRDDLARAYLPERLAEARPVLAVPRNSESRAECLTDLDAVRKQMNSVVRGPTVDADCLFERLSAVVRGQDDAIRVLARRVSHHAARRASRRPATIFAIGPTGVGKTRTAEALAAVLRDIESHDASYRYLRLDMSEYQERYRISQLLGAPQGYVGYGDGAQLVDALASNPRTVVLFDEVEKAHPDILRALMNAMDAGRLSTPSARAGRSRQIDCRQAIFMFTSNLDPAGILRSISEYDGSPTPDAVAEICRTQLALTGVSPELIGRISCFLVFRPLNVDVRAEIIALAIASVASEYGLQVRHIEPAVILHFLENRREARFGARPFEYMIDEVLGDCFAMAGAIRAGNAISVEGPPFRCTVWRPSETVPGNTGQDEGHE